MNRKLRHMMTLFGVLFALAEGAAADTVTFDFSLPATGKPSVGTSYPNVATLSITDVAGGVQMALTPNWSSSGWDNKKGGSVQRLDIVFPSLSGAFAFTNDSGAKIKSWKVSNNAGMDTSYKSNASVFSVKFDTSNKSDFDSSFANSIWSVIGKDLSTASFNGLFAEANNKISPIFGVISVQGYALDGLTPTPSNWVAGAAVPIPAAAWLFGSALFGLGGLGYRRSRTRVV
jgi:hypothetical protein